MAVSRVPQAARQADLIDAITDYAFYFLDKAGVILRRNLCVDHIDGYWAKELLGLHLSALFTLEDRNAGKPGNILSRAEKGGRDEFIGWIRRKDGSRFWGRLTINPMFDGGRKLTGFACVVRDITDRYEARRRLDKMQDELAEARKMQAIGQLIGGIAHDFSNILMVILGNAENARALAARNDAPADLQAAIDRVMRGGERAAGLVQNLAAYAHESPAARSEAIRTDGFLRRLPAVLRSRMSPMPPVDVVGDSVWSMLGDESRLFDAVAELVANAAEAGAPSARVVVEAANVVLDADYCTHNPEVSPGPYVLIAVTDTGEGMTKETASRALEPYFSTRTMGTSRGLGLTRAYGVVKEAGGHIKIYSERGLGTTVKLYLRASDAAGLPDEAGATIPVAFVNETVLVTEDDPDVRTYVTQVLRELNYRVFAVESAEAALELLERREIRPDLLLSDVVLPGMGGKQLAEAVLERHPSTKILFMTGFGRNAVLRGGRIQVGFGLLQKPISRDVLADSVRAILDPPPGSGRRRKMDG
jgi:PAS domain S-box-containing protein